MLEVQPFSRQELVRTAMTATLDALRPKQRHKRRRISKHHSPPPPLSSPLSPSSALQGSLLHGFIGSPPPFHQPHLLHQPHLSHQLSENLPPNACSIPHYGYTPETMLSVEWIGHASMMISLSGKRILADPVFSERVGVEIFGKIIGIERYTASAFPLETIPKPDIIVLSHAHLDHTDLPTLRYLTAQFPEEIHLVTAKNTADIMGNLPWKTLTELDWEEEISLEGITVCGLETRHNGWRLPWERDRAQGYTSSGRSYNGYLLSANGRKIVFAGDTAYFDGFSSLRNENIDIAIMPIGAYQGYETLHCTPEQALRMADAMRAEYLVPMHFGTFDQSEEEPHEPLERLLAALPYHKTTLALSRVGECFAM